MMRELGSSLRPQQSPVSTSGSTAHIDCDPARRFLALVVPLTAATRFLSCTAHRIWRFWELSFDAFGEHGGMAKTKKSTTSPRRLQYVTLWSRCGRPHDLHRVSRPPQWHYALWSIYKTIPSQPWLIGSGQLKDNSKLPAAATLCMAETRISAPHPMFLEDAPQRLLSDGALMSDNVWLHLVNLNEEDVSSLLSPLSKLQNTKTNARPARV